MIPRICVNGELRVHGREVEIVVRPGWTASDLLAAASLAGAPVCITVEQAPPEPEPLTGGNADIGVRVRVVPGPTVDPCIAGRTGVLRRYDRNRIAAVEFSNEGLWGVSVNVIERAPAECPQCGASQVNR